LCSDCCALYAAIFVSEFLSNITTIWSTDYAAIGSTVVCSEQSSLVRSNRSADWCPVWLSFRLALLTTDDSSILAADWCAYGAALDPTLKAADRASFLVAIYSANCNTQLPA
jgi:hypothetical protein